MATYGNLWQPTISAPGRDDGPCCAIPFRHGIKVGLLMDSMDVVQLQESSETSRTASAWMREFETASIAKWVTGPLIAPKSLRRFDFDVC